MDKQLITERVGKVAASVVAEMGIELVHIEISGTKRDLVLRIYIDRPGSAIDKDRGVTLDDCSRVSQAIEDVLDVEDFIPTRYVLEVSSPGIERQLYSLADFAKFSGKLARVKTREAIGGQKTFAGYIKEVDGSHIVFDDRTRGRIEFEYDDVEKANLKIDLAQEFGSGRSRKK
jgi:ribosome maturation factor RimP